MATYLFAWNPSKWKWRNLSKQIEKVKKIGYCQERWSTGVTKRIAIGDRAFLIKLGDGNPGIMASGWVASNVFEDIHWDLEKAKSGKIALFVNGMWDTLLDPSKIFLTSNFKHNIYKKMHWEPQASGVRIPDDVAEQLEKDWRNFLKRPALEDITLAEEVDKTKTYKEGSIKQITINVYERKPAARAMCLSYYGAHCAVCGFNFKFKYGEIGEDFIHVHHLKPLSEIGEKYELNPLEDLRPVCPNCHAMIHKRKPAFSISELQKIIEQSK